MMKLIKGEPVRFFAALQALVTYGVNGVVMFHLWHPDADQLGWVNGLIMSVGMFVSFFYVREQVTPVPVP